MTTIKAATQGDAHKKPIQHEWRTMTDAEILALGYNDHPHVLLNNGRVGTVKINGKVRTWKTDPDRIEVPLKYGLYDHAVFSFNEARARLLVKVENTKLDKPANEPA